MRLGGADVLDNYPTLFDRQECLSYLAGKSWRGMCVGFCSDEPLVSIAVLQPP